MKIATQILSELNFVFYFKEKLIRPILGFLRQGITPKKMALTIALGVILGLFPILGSTTIICSIVAILLRLNLAVINVINFFVYPLQLLLFIPLIKLGEFIFKINPMPYSLDEIADLFQNNTLLAFEKLWFANLIGIAAWAVIALPIFVSLYFGSLFFFNKMMKERES